MMSPREDDSAFFRAPVHPEGEEAARAAVAEIRRLMSELGEVRAFENDGFHVLAGKTKDGSLVAVTVEQYTT
jgi:hypothetical protein